MIKLSGSRDLHLKAYRSIVGAYSVRIWLILEIEFVDRLPEGFSRGLATDVALILL